MGSLSLTHWLIVLLVVVLLFGTSKLKNAGRDLGNAVKGFKDAVQDSEYDKQTQDKKAQDKTAPEPKDSHGQS